MSGSMGQNESLLRASTARWRKLLGVLGLLSTLMLIYGSLIPLQYRPLGWAETFERWRSIPWIQLGIHSRADWIANGLLVVPIAFLLTGASIYRIERRRGIDWLCSLVFMTLVLAFLFALVYGIELLQVWFPPRTVSWNDIASGWIGALVGVVLWICIGRRLIFEADRFLGIKRFEDRLKAFSVLACAAVFFYSIYPLDIVVSPAEWSEKFKQGRIHWVGLSSSTSKFELLQGLVVSTLRMVPAGVLGLSIKAPRVRWAWILGMGVFLELVQLPIFSKYSSASDIFFGWLGGMIGVWVARPSRFWNWLLERRWVWICGSVCWCGLLLAAFLGRSESWVVDSEDLNERWSGFFTYPMLRYYYTSEYSALTNLVGKLMSFSLLGALVAGSLIFGNRSLTNRPYRFSILWALGISISLGLAIEIAQIYLAPFVGDLTDVGVYATGASAGAWLMVFLVKGFSLNAEIADEQARLLEKEAYSNKPQSNLSSKSFRLTPFARSLGIGVLICGGIVAGLHPGWPWAQMCLVGFVSGVVYWIPRIFPCLFILALVAGDAYPMTGQLCLQEYDSLLVGAFAGLCLAHWRDQDADFRLGIWAEFKDRNLADRLLLFGLSLLALSTIISLLVGVYRLPSAPWGDQLSVYFTHWNAIRVGKGIFWGVVFAASTTLLGSRCVGSVRDAWKIAFLRGFAFAGFYVGGFVFIERAIFPGLFNWTDVYRATGPFFTMHIGDQHLDAFVVLAFPWVWANWMRDGCTRLERFFCAVVLMLLAYAAFSTMSRATLVVILFQVVLLVALGWRGISVRSGRIANGLIAGGFGSILAIGIFMALQTHAVQGRFISLSQDWNSRVKHWSMILSRGTSGIGGLSIGHGLGTLPSLVAAEFGRPVPPLSWRSVDEKGSRRGEIQFLGQWPIYLERWISKPYQEQSSGGLQLQIKRVYNREVRDQHPLQVQPMLVEKSMLESFGSIRLPATGVSGTWGALGWSDPGAFGLREDLGSNRGSWINLRPWTAGLSVSGRGGVVIQSAQGMGDLGVNSTSSYPWFFTCDDHMVWRAKNFLVHAYYEQGLVGVLAWSVLILVGLWRGLRSRSIVGSAQAVSIVGFVGVGFFGTLIDTPWITAILLGILSLNWIRSDGIEYTEL